MNVRNPRDSDMTYPGVGCHIHVAAISYGCWSEWADHNATSVYRFVDNNAGVRRLGVDLRVRLSKGGGKRTKVAEMTGNIMNVFFL